MDPLTFTETRQCYVQFNSAVALMINLYETVNKRIYNNSSMSSLDRSLLATAIKANPSIVLEQVNPILENYRNDIVNGNLEVISSIDFFKFGKNEEDAIRIKKHEMMCKRLLGVASDDEKTTLIETARYMLLLCDRYNALRKLNK